MAKRPSTKQTKLNSQQRRTRMEMGLGPEESIFDAFEGYAENWPGVYEEKKKPVDIINQLYKRQKFTPDFKKLRLQQNILVFVCDALVYAGSEHKHLVNSKYLGKATSLHDSYALRGSKFAVLIDHVQAKSEKAKIKGELYAVSPETLLDLDRVRFNTVMHQREERTFFLNDQKYKTKAGKRVPSVKAWVYLAKKECWNSADHLPLFPRYCYAGLKNKMYYEYFPRTSIFPERPHHAPYPMDQHWRENELWHEHVG